MSDVVATATSTVRARPTESSTVVVGAIVGLLGHVFHWDSDVMSYLVVIVGALPIGITWLVNTLRRR